MTESKEEKGVDKMDVDELFDDTIARSKLIDLVEYRFQLTLSDDVVSVSTKSELKNKIMTIINENDMGPFYKSVCVQFNWQFDETLYNKLIQNCEERLKVFEEERLSAEKNEGETEVRDSMVAKADYLSLAGDKETALKARNESLEKTVGAASRIDEVLCLIRLGLFYNDMNMVQENIDKAKDLADKGGDWERRNLLKVYEGVYKVLTRDWKEAALLFLDSLATFTCYDMMSYEQLIFYAVITSLLSCDRQIIRKRVIKSPEILSVYEDIPNLKTYLESLYRCNYGSFFDALEKLSNPMKADAFMSAHHAYWFREMRIVAYSQFLQSYRSVKLSSMAEAFGVSSSFLDTELSRFIALSRLNAKIEKVNGIVETNRADHKNAQYQSILRQGDILLNRIQRLTKIITY